MNNLSLGFLGDQPFAVPFLTFDKPRVKFLKVKTFLLKNGLASRSNFLHNRINPLFRFHIITPLGCILLGKESPDLD